MRTANGFTRYRKANAAAKNYKRDYLLQFTCAITAFIASALALNLAVSSSVNAGVKVALTPFMPIIAGMLKQTSLSPYSPLSMTETQRTLSAPLKIGDVAKENVAGSGVNLVVTEDIK